MVPRGTTIAQRRGRVKTIEWRSGEDDRVEEGAHGLALTKRLVEGHGGEIVFTSRPDAGTTSMFTLTARRTKRNVKR